ncbi:MAG: zinc finger domain-containing protein, partial [bacterium]
LDDNSHLYFNDLRKFGWSRLLNKNELDKATEHYGPEPLSKNFTSKFLIEIFKQHPKSTIKKILLDQTLIAGIGNIYADEACFLARLRPDRQVGTLNNKDITLLQEQIVAVLKLSIKHKGTSSRNYRRSDGSQGGFVPHLYVYGRSGDPCKVCGGTLVKMKHVGRGTHYCERCQI